ncbi:hypothetical protein QC762_0040270 [Podospora pseudocomata]|uniref:Uncharacterized protein n=1 Tax=Podospora pseudocomata TaxID=2093779 RepID=A0ABR0GMD3_9PEZI|nr:hypothetical protein QC762_0040270 [Podospora pseudocomata]
MSPCLLLSSRTDTFFAFCSNLSTPSPIPPISCRVSSSSAQSVARLELLITCTRDMYVAATVRTRNKVVNTSCVLWADNVTHRFVIERAALCITVWISASRFSGGGNSVVKKSPSRENANALADPPPFEATTPRVLSSSNESSIVDASNMDAVNEVQTFIVKSTESSAFGGLSKVNSAPP